MTIPLSKYNSNNKVSKIGMLHDVGKSLKCVVVICRSNKATRLKPTYGRKCHCPFRWKERLVKALIELVLRLCAVLTIT